MKAAEVAGWTALEAIPGVRIHIAAAREALCRLELNRTDEEFAAELTQEHPEEDWRRDDGHRLLIETRRQLEAYFRGEMQEFDLPLALRGTEFQRRVWRALLTIPYGETRSCLDIARQIGSPKACRAVGAANRANRVAIVVPCHRVIAADGSLGGFGGGLEVKKLLLDMEASAALYP